MRELKALRLVDADQPDAVNLRALNGLAAKRLVPFAEEGGEVGGLLADTGGKLVVEGAEIGALALLLVELEQAVELLGQLVGRQAKQFIGVVDEGFGQHVVERGGMQGLVAVSLGQSGTGNEIVGADKQAHGLDNGHDGRRGVEPEGFVAHHADFGQTGREIVGNERNLTVYSHQDGYRGIGHLLPLELKDGLGDGLERALPVVFLRQEPDADVAFLLAAVRHLLGHVVVGRDCFVLSSLGEEDVVESDDRARRAVVGVEGADVQLTVGIGKLAANIGQQPPVAAAPAVDALLHVAHNQVLSALVAHGLFKEHLEVLPLHGRGVLELVDHDVLQLGAHLLEDERGVAPLDELMQQLLGVAEQEAVGSPQMPSANWCSSMLRGWVFLYHFSGCPMQSVTRLPRTLSSKMPLRSFRKKPATPVLP